MPWVRVWPPTCAPQVPAEPRSPLTAKALTARPTLIVTRPALEAPRWVAALSARGWPVRAWPLIDIEPVRSDTVRAALAEAAADWPRFDAIMFVSGNAVRGLCQARLAQGMAAVDAGPRLWVTGAGTAKALLDAGASGSAIDRPDVRQSASDSEGLWAEVRRQVKPGWRVLIVRGGNSQEQAEGRDWLAKTLVAHGALVRECVAYLRHAPVWDEAQTQAAQRAAADGSIWLCASAEGLNHLARLLPQQDWSKARALATHPRIALVARRLGFGVVVESMPSLDAVAASIESMG